MKKIAVLFVALTMMVAMVLPVAAASDPYYSPQATIVDNSSNQNGSSNSSSTSPQTDSFNWMILVVGGAAVSLSCALITGKKIRKAAQD